TLVRIAFYKDQIVPYIVIPVVLFFFGYSLMHIINSESTNGIARDQLADWTIKISTLLSLAVTVRFFVMGFLGFNSIRDLEKVKQDVAKINPIALKFVRTQIEDRINSLLNIISIDFLYDKTEDLQELEVLRSDIERAESDISENERSNTGLLVKA